MGFGVQGFFFTTGSIRVCLGLDRTLEKDSVVLPAVEDCIGFYDGGLTGASAV